MPAEALPEAAVVLAADAPGGEGAAGTGAVIRQRTSPSRWERCSIDSWRAGT